MKSLILFFICFIIFASCTKDFVEPDISSKEVVILAPSDSLSTSTSSVTFWWEEIEGARKYRIQVVKPSFAALQQIITDTLVSGDKFIWSFSPGNYQWRIRAENTISETEFITRSFTIDSTLDLTSQTVVLTSPQSGALLNETSVGLQWNSLYNASSYHVQVLDQGSLALIIEDTVSTAYLNTTLPEGAFTWQVKAINSTSSSNFYSSSFTIDTTRPAASTFISPFYDQTLTTLDTIKWNRYPGTAADSLIIVSDTISYSNQTAVLRQDNFYKFIGASGVYFIRIKSVDSAGNWSNFSTPWRRFTQQ